jgi:hypothetical protein
MNSLHGGTQARADARVHFSQKMPAKVVLLVVLVALVVDLWTLWCKPCNIWEQNGM